MRDENAVGSVGWLDRCTRSPVMPTPAVPPELRQALIQVLIEEDWDQDGAAYLADVAVRRWGSFTRRHQAKRATHDARVRDLARGLRQRWPVDPIWAYRTEFHDLAVLLAGVLRDHDR
jgi:hypothetical protein